MNRTQPFIAGLLGGLRSSRAAGPSPVAPLDAAPAAGSEAQAGLGRGRSSVPHLRPLTGLRFLAALLVVAFHFLPLDVIDGHGPLHLVTAALHNVVANGFSGVGFFFILSGFILTYSYLTAQGRLRVGRRDFWLARFARVYPVYFLALILAFIPFGQGSGPTTLADVGLDVVVAGVANLALLQAWLPGTESVWNPPGWSLSAEAFFYLLFPLLALGVARLPRRRLVQAVVLAWATTVLVALAYLVVAPDGAAYQGTWYHRHWLMVLYQNPLVRLPEFLMGVALGRLFVLNRAGGLPQRRSMLSPARVSALALCAVAAALAAGPFPITLFNQVALDPLFALLIYSLARGEGPLAAFFSLSPVIVLGEASYAVYILHWPLHLPAWKGVNSLLQALNPSLMGTNLFFAAYLGLVIGVSILSLRVVERPARRAIKRAFAPRRPAAAREPEWSAGSAESSAAAR